MNGNQNLPDKWINNIVRWHAESDMRLKYACIAAGRVVGSYNGATGIIAKRTKRSVSTVENWAHAWRLYADLRKNGNRIRVRTLFRELPASHWWLAYDIYIAGYDALYYLTNAYAHSISGREMLREFAQDREAGYAPLMLKRACLSFYGLALELEKRNGELSKSQHAAVLEVKREFQAERTEI